MQGPDWETHLPTNWLARLRYDYGWTQKDLAYYLDVSPSFLSDIEQGRRRMADRELQQLAYKAKLTVGELRYRQAVEEGSFDLPMPEGHRGRESARRLLTCWETLEEEQFDVLVATLCYLGKEE